MIDVHCHLNLKSFNSDYDAVAKQAFEAGVSKIINVGTSLETSRKAVELAQKYENMYAIVGIHPHHADKLEPDRLPQLEKLASEPKVVAIGEIGMDFYRYKSNGITDPKLQRELFVEQIKLAHRLKLPLQIHNRHAGSEILEVLEEHKNLLLEQTPGMFHCFAGTLEVHKKALELGFCLGFDGNITYAGLAPGETVELSKLVELTPIERIVTETDAPFLTPEPHRGSRNIPSYVILVAEAISRIKNIPVEEVKNQTTQNAQTLFKI